MKFPRADADGEQNRATAMVARDLARPGAAEQHSFAVVRLAVFSCLGKHEACRLVRSHRLLSVHSRQACPTSSLEHFRHSHSCLGKGALSTIRRSAYRRRLDDNSCQYLYRHVSPRCQLNSINDSDKARILYHCTSCPSSRFLQALLTASGGDKRQLCKQTQRRAKAQRNDRRVGFRQRRTG